MNRFINWTWNRGHHGAALRMWHAQQKVRARYREEFWDWLLAAFAVIAVLAWLAVVE